MELETVTKKWIGALLIALTLCAFVLNRPTNLPAAAAFSGLSGNAESGGNTLIVYFSWSSAGNTEKMAQAIQEQTGGDLLRPEPRIPYPADYSARGEIARVERDENARPEIANLPESVSEYDAIFIGYPIWWHTAPMIIGTLLEACDVTGAEIYPFTQSAAMDMQHFQNSMAFLRETVPGANVHEDLFTPADDLAGIQDYLAANGFAL